MKNVTNNENIFDVIESNMFSVLVSKDKRLNYNLLVKIKDYIDTSGENHVNKEEIIDLNKLNSVFAIPSTFLNKGLIKNISVNKVMTIENETTFNYLTDPSYLYVFSKGHPTKKVINFLKIVKESSNDIKFYHCGDIDWGGFNIYFDLLEKTGIDFELYNMDSITLEKFKRFAKPLSDIDKRNLLSLKEKDKVKKNQNIAKTIDFMLENNLKLEQEAIN